MHFKRAARSINRPHFLAERDGDILMLNFCQDHKSVRTRTLNYNSDEMSFNTSGSDSMFGYDGRPRPYMNSRFADAGMGWKNFVLQSQSKNGLGAYDGKVYFLDDSPRTDLMNVWRVDAETGDNEFSKAPSGFITRFSDSDYFLVSFKGIHSIYQWKTGDEAELIRKVKHPKDVNDRTRIAYGSKIFFLKIEGDKILITSLDVISEEVWNKTITLDNVVDPTTRWLAAANHLIAVVSGRVIFIETTTLAYEIAPTNLDPSGKYHPFAVDSNGFVYVLCPTTDGCTVQRARDSTLATVEEKGVVIPKQEQKERVRAPKKEQKDKGPKEERNWDEIKYINVGFTVTYRGQILFNQSMRMLVTKPLGDVIRRSPEIEQPPNTRLKLFFKNEEHLSFRTPNFLRMKDGDAIQAQFVDKDDTLDAPSSSSSSTAREDGFFTREMLDEMSYDTPEVKKVPKKREERKGKKEVLNEGSQDRHFFSNKDRVFAPKPFREDGPSRSRFPSSSSQDPPQSSQLSRMEYTKPLRETERREAMESRKEETEEKLLREMQWLRNFVEGKLPHIENGQPDDPLQLLQKKYARVLMMMGRSSLKK